MHLLKNFPGFIWVLHANDIDIIIKVHFLSNDFGNNYIILFFFIYATIIVSDLILLTTFHIFLYDIVIMYLV